MKRLLGRVLVRETNSGVPNLVVAAYDSTDDAAPERVASAQSFGRRIASVLTDASGAFAFPGDDLVFNGNEIRPNLLIAVFAPEDVQSAEWPVPLPPEKRILYVSAVPRVDAGAEEAFIIRLLQEQLNRFSIPFATPSHEYNESLNRMQRAIEDSLALREGLKELVAPRLRREQQRVGRIRELAASKVSTLSAIPLHLRSGELRNNRFLIESRSELSERLKKMQDDSIKDGLKRLGTLKPTLTLTLSLDELQALGLTYRAGKLKGSVDQKKLNDISRTLMSGFDLVRRRGLNNPAPEELQRRYLSAPGLTLLPVSPEDNNKDKEGENDAPPATVQPRTKSKAKSRGQQRRREG